MRAAALRFITDDSGATLVEYGIVTALVSTAAIVAMTAFGTEVNTMFTSIVTTMNTFSNGAQP